jgi:hypothetical protein
VTHQQRSLMITGVAVEDLRSPEHPYVVRTSFWLSTWYSGLCTGGGLAGCPASEDPWLMTEHIMFRPVHNGLDYLESVIEHLRDESDQRDLKYAVLHLQAAVEVLLKVRLIREHWSLVFEKPSAANRAAFATGNFKSITLEDTLIRLNNIADVEVPGPDREQFLRLANKRNKLQHFGMEERAIGIEHLAGQVLDGLLRFIRDHLRPGAAPEEEHALNQTQELIREKGGRIRALVAARSNRIEPELAAHAVVVHCPDCLHSSLPIDHGCLQCRFCDRTWEPEGAANQYVDAMFGLLRYGWYTGDLPVPCMECRFQTLVAGATVRSNPEEVVWVCFNCGMVYNDGEISNCLRCGKVMRHVDDKPGLCEGCLRDVRSD